MKTPAVTIAKLRLNWKQGFFEKNACLSEYNDLERSSDTDNKHDCDHTVARATPDEGQEHDLHRHGDREQDNESSPITAEFHLWAVINGQDYYNSIVPSTRTSS